MAITAALREVRRPTPARKGREKWSGSFTELVRWSCARKDSWKKDGGRGPRSGALR